MSFDDVLFPLPLAFGASGGPERRTEIVTLGSGRETRNALWAHGRRRYDLSGAALGLDDLAALVAFFEARRGRLRGFRFRDPLDWRSGPPSQAPRPTDQTLTALSATTFQLAKTYGDYVRPIRKPAAGTVRVAVAGAELAPGGFAIDHATGIITLPAAPTGALTAGFAFDVPVRFDIDRLEVSLDGFGAGRIASAPLVEIVD